MDFNSIAQERQSCRKFNSEKKVEKGKLFSVIETAVLAPSACNSQPYRITVFEDEKAKEVAHHVQGMGMNGFATDARVMLVISEAPYNSTAALGAKLKNNDYRSIDIGILTSYITLRATELGLSTCILGWFDDKRIRQLCGIEAPVRLVIAMGYSIDDYPLRQKKRKDISEIVTFK